MVKNLKRMRKQVEKEQGKLEAAKWDFFPTTYELPSEYHIFVEEFKRHMAQNTIWIMKPAARSQGKGIFLFRKLKDITDWRKAEPSLSPEQTQPPPETYVVSRYIDHPYLIGGRKFDLRVYVIVTAVDSLFVHSPQGVATLTHHGLRLPTFCIYLYSPKFKSIPLCIPVYICI